MIFEISSTQMGFCTFFWESKKFHFREILVIQTKHPLLSVHCFYTLLGHLKQSWTKEGFIKIQAIRWLLLGKHLWNCLNSINVTSWFCEDIT